MSHSHKQYLERPILNVLKELVTVGVKKAMFYADVVDQRRELMHLSDSMLKDIGLTRTDAEKEYNRVFWDVNTTQRNDFAVTSLPLAHDNTCSPVLPHEG